MTSFIFYDDKMVRLLKPREESARLTAERDTFSLLKEIFVSENSAQRA